MSKRKLNIFADIDWIIVLVYILLVFIGWMNIYSAVFEESHSSFFDFEMRYGKQIVWIIAAFLMAIFVLSVDSRFYNIFAYLMYGIGLFLLLSVLFFGVEVNSSKSWLEFGAVRIQVAEFIKITTCLAVARYISKLEFDFRNIKQFIVLALIVLLPMLLILAQNDTGSALVFCSFIFVLFREGFSRTIFIALFALIGLFLLALLISPEVLLLIVFAVVVMIFRFVNGKNIYSRIITYSYNKFSKKIKY